MSWDIYDTIRTFGLFVMLMSIWNDDNLCYYFVVTGLIIIILNSVIETYFSKKEVK